MASLESWMTSLWTSGAPSVQSRISFRLRRWLNSGLLVAESALKDKRSPVGMACEQLVSYTDSQ